MSQTYKSIIAASELINFAWRVAISWLVRYLIWQSTTIHLKLDRVYFGFSLKLYLNENDCLAVNSGCDDARRVVQEYIDKPLLLSGYKSHVRLYALISSVDPLRLFIHQGALLHLAGEKYLSPTEGNLVGAVLIQLDPIPNTQLFVHTGWPKNSQPVSYKIE